MVKETSLEFRLSKIDETGNYPLDETKHNDLMSKKCKKTCKYLNYVPHLLFLFQQFLVAFQFLQLNHITSYYEPYITSFRYYELCGRNKNLCNHCRN